MESDVPILFEELSDFARMRMYVKMATMAMKKGCDLPRNINGIFSPEVLDEIGELYSEINGLMKKGG